MSERNPRKSGLSPSPVSLALFIVVATIVALGALYVLTLGMTAPAPTQTGAMAKPNASNNTQNRESVVAAQVAVTAEAPVYEETEIPTPDIPTPTQPPDPTPYTPGPTSQFTTIVPTEDWLVYVDEQAGFSVKYPPDWYLTTTPLEERVFGSTTQLYSYDPNDPNPVPKGTNPADNFIKLTIVSDSLQAMGWPFLPGETLTEWVQRTQPRSGDEQQILEEREASIGGLPAYFQKTIYKGTEAATFYVHRDANMVYVGYFVRPSGSIHEQLIETILASLRFFE